MNNGKRIAAALICLGMMTAAAVPAALAEKADGDKGETAETRVEISGEAGEKLRPRAEISHRASRRGGRGRHARHEEASEPENAIGKDAAKETALNDAGIASDQAEKLRARVSDKDGAVVYKVRFVSDGQKYSYRIDPLTGEVLDKTVEENAPRSGHRPHRGTESVRTEDSVPAETPTV